MSQKKITLHDMTLRDGMHPKRHLMTLDQMKSIACGLRTQTPHAAAAPAACRERRR